MSNDAVCWHRRFAPNACPKPAKWKGRFLGNYTDDWTWCDDHKPEDARPIEETDAEREARKGGERG